MQIELNELTGGGRVRSLSGQERGVAARAKFKLDQLDQRNEPVTVSARDLDAVTASFLQGMFSKSIILAKDRDAFLRRFQFDAPAEILRQVDRAIVNTLVDRSRPLDA